MINKQLEKLKELLGYRYKMDDNTTSPKGIVIQIEKERITDLMYCIFLIQERIRLSKKFKEKKDIKIRIEAEDNEEYFYIIVMEA